MIFLELIKQNVMVETHYDGYIDSYCFRFVRGCTFYFRSVPRSVILSCKSGDNLEALECDIVTDAMNYFNAVEREGTKPSALYSCIEEKVLALRSLPYVSLSPADQNTVNAWHRYSNGELEWRIRNRTDIRRQYQLTPEMVDMSNKFTQKELLDNMRNALNRHKEFQKEILGNWGKPTTDGHKADYIIQDEFCNAVLPEDSVHEKQMLKKFLNSKYGKLKEDEK